MASRDDQMFKAKQLFFAEELPTSNYYFKIKCLLM